MTWQDELAWKAGIYAMENPWVQPYMTTAWRYAPHIKTGAAFASAWTASELMGGFRGQKRGRVGDVAHPGGLVSDAIYGRQHRSYAGQSASRPLTSTATKLCEMALFNTNQSSLRGDAYAGIADIALGQRKAGRRHRGRRRRMRY